MKIKKLIQLIILSFLLNSCGSGLKDALQGKKRSDNSDEFLVKKKNPLILPPNYGELPVPSSESINQETFKEEEVLDVKKILKIENTDEKVDKEKCSAEKTDECLENSILERIKNL
tara:strand:- start:35 stop:382 length:348 start_codon:yes stop_codon:yes gene_type:complete